MLLEGLARTRALPWLVLGVAIAFHLNSTFLEIENLGDESRATRFADHYRAGKAFRDGIDPYPQEATAPPITSSPRKDAAGAVMRADSSTDRVPSGEFRGTPVVALVHAPLGETPYRRAAAISLIANELLLALSIVLLLLGFPSERRRPALIGSAIIIVFPPVAEIFEEGSIELLVVALWMGALLAFSRGGRVLSGILLGTAAGFFPLALIFVLPFARRREWRLLAASAAALLATAAAPVAWGRGDLYGSYLRTVLDPFTGATASGDQSVLAFLTALLPAPLATTVAIVLAVGVVGIIWHRAGKRGTTLGEQALCGVGVLLVAPAVVPWMLVFAAPALHLLIGETLDPRAREREQPATLVLDAALVLLLLWVPAQVSPGLQIQGAVRGLSAPKPFHFARSARLGLAALVFARFSMAPRREDTKKPRSHD